MEKAVSIFKSMTFHTNKERSKHIKLNNTKTPLAKVAETTVLTHSSFQKTSTTTVY